MINANEIYSMFNGCSSLITLPDISKWKFSKVKDISSMFNGCKSLVSIPDISKWETKEVENVSYMFYECRSLISLPDLTKWNINNITNMKKMFYGCYSLVSLPDLSLWKLKISNPEININEMLLDCFSLFSIPEKWEIYELESKELHKDDYDGIKIIDCYPIEEDENINKKQNETNFETIINDYKNKITYLEEKIKISDKINLKIPQEDKKIKDLTILQMEKIINIYEKKLNNIGENKNPRINKLLENENKEEEPFYVIFNSLNLDIHYRLPCRKNDLISKLEKELCIKFKQYKEYDIILTVKGKEIKRYKTIEENEIKNGDMIIIHINY
jgi:surface protein